MDDLEFYRDESGQARARGADERLAIYLETDLQASIEICEELLQFLADKDCCTDITGNAHCVTLSSKTVTIESTADPDAPDRRLTRDEFQHVIKDWLSFIRQTA